MKDMYVNPLANITLSGESMKDFPLKSEKNDTCSTTIFKDRILMQPRVS
jgi:hypothetical protein